MDFAFPPALRHRPFRFLWFAHIASVAGRRMQLAIVLWHIRELGGQPILLGSIGLVQFLPVLLLGLFAGSVADTVNRIKLMVLTSLGLVFLSVSLGWLEILEQTSMLMIFFLVLASSALGAFDIPAKFSTVPNVVPRQDLPSAFSLVTIAFHLGNIVGPGLVGVVIGRLGIGYAYLINGALYLIVILLLFQMGSVKQDQVLKMKQSLKTNAAKEGLQFVFQHPLILPSMLLDFLGTLFASATSLLPIFATDILGVGAVGYTWLVAARSIGGGFISLLLSFISKIHRQGILLLITGVLFGFATVLFGISKSYLLTFLALMIVGGSDALSTVIRQTIRQLQTPDWIRGRMTSVNQIFFSGGPQLGELRAGLTAQWFGSPLAVISGGILCVLATLWIGFRFPKLALYNGDEPVTVALSPDSS